MMNTYEEVNSAILPLTIDGVFKIYFEDPRNLPELKRFLKANLELCDDDLAEIEVLNPGLLKANVNDKGFTVDLLLKTNSNNDIHIEMQTERRSNFKERVQIYNARRAGSQIKVGEDYSKVKRTISLVITDFKMFDDSDKYQEKIMMCREDGKVFTELQEINIIDLTKLTTAKINNREMYLWGKLFKAKTREELEMLAKESEEMAEATEKLFQVSADERAQAYAFSRENAEFARVMHEQGLKEQAKQAIEEGVKQGIEQGIKQGAFKKAVEMAKSLLQAKMSIEEIAKHTKLPVEEIKNLID